MFVEVQKFSDLIQVTFYNYHTIMMQFTLDYLFNFVTGNTNYDNVATYLGK